MSEQQTACDASAIGSGTLAAARGGAGASNGLLKADGAGLVSAATAGTDYYKAGATTSAPSFIPLYLTVFAPADGAVYYAGAAVAFTGAGNASTTDGRRSISLPAAGTITAASIRVINDGTAGTSETSTIALRLNDTSDTTLTAALTTNASATFSATGLSLAISAGDRLSLKWTCPTWATNPTNIYITVMLEIHP